MTKKRPHDAKNRSEENIHIIIQYEFKKCNGRNRDNAASYLYFQILIHIIFITRRKRKAMCYKSRYIIYFWQ